LNEAQKVGLLSPAIGIDLPLMRRMIETSRVHYYAALTYVPRTYHGRITLFRTNEIPENTQDPTLGWGNLATEGVELHIVEGDHSTMVYEPYARAVAERILQCMQQKEA